MSEAHENVDISPAVQGYIALNEMLNAMLEAGWSREDAIRYVAIWSVEVGREAPPDAES